MQAHKDHDHSFTCGVQARVRVGPVPGSGLRGLVATEDIPAGESAIAVPAALCVQLGSAASQGAVRRT